MKKKRARYIRSQKRKLALRHRMRLDIILMLISLYADW